MEKTQKGQATSYGLVVIIVAIAAFFFIYMVMIYPAERQEILSDYFEKFENQTNLPENAKLIFKAPGTSIGSVNLEKVEYSFKLEDVSLSYPTINKIIDSIGNTIISTSIIKRGVIIFNANNIDDNTKEVMLNLNITGVVGKPTLRVYINKTLVYEDLAQKGEFKLRIDKRALKEDNPIYIRLEHNGMFWERQSITLSSGSIEKVEYSPIKPSQTQKINLGQNIPEGNTIMLEFLTEKATDNNLILNINNKAVSWIKPPENEISSVTLTREESNLKVGENLISFSTDKGGEFKLTDVILKIITKPAPTSTRTYNFDIPSEYLYDAFTEIKVGIIIKDIISKGDLTVKIKPYDAIYYIPNSQISQGATLYVKLDKSKLKNLGNQIEISSPNGIFYTDGFFVIAQQGV